jgi:hypothetical protein
VNLVWRSSIATLAIVLSSCAATPRTDPGAGADSARVSAPSAKGPRWSGTGTVRHLELEGGFYGIAGDDGTQFDVSDLPAELRRDGARVRYILEEIPKAMSFHMWGKIVRVIEIEALP